MAKLNCLIKNTKLVDEIQDFIAQIVVSNIENGGSIKIGDIYAQLRGYDIEVDRESVGYLYNNLYGNEKSKDFSTQKQVEEFALKVYRATQKEIANNIINSNDDNKDEDNKDEDDKKDKQIGDLSPEKSIVNTIAKLFNKTYFPKIDEQTKSIMLQMEDMIRKSVLSKLEKPTNTPISINKALQDFFNTENNQFRTIQGIINNLQTLDEAVRDEINKYVDETAIKNKLTSEQKENLKEEWDSYVSDFMDSVYDIVLSKGEQKALLTEALSNIQIDGKDILDSNGNIKWSYLSKELNIDDVIEKVEELFLNGFTDKSGNDIKFTPIQSYRIAQYFGNLLQEKINAVRQRDIANERAVQLSPKNLISDFIKSLGFFKLTKDSAGQLNKISAKWDKLLNEAKNAKSKGQLFDFIGGIKKELENFLRGKDNNGEMLFDISEKKIENILNEFEKLLTAKLIPKTATVQVLHKLGALTQLNNGIVFNNQTQQAINSLLGISGVSQQYLDQIRELSELAQKILSNDDISSAFQILAQIERRIKELVYEHKKQQIASGLNNLQGIQDFLSLMKTSILANPNNIIENIITNIATSTSSLITLYTKLPFKYWGDTGKVIAKTLINGLFSHIFGGANENILTDYDKMEQLSYGERLRFTSTDLKKLKDAPIKEIAKIPQKLVATVYRVIMNSIDASMLEAVMQIEVISSLYDNIGKAYGEDARDKAMDKFFNITKEDKAIIKTALATIRAEMNKLGIYPNNHDMRLAYQQALINRYAMGLIDDIKDIDKKQLSQQINSIIKGAIQSTRKILGKSGVKYSFSDIASWLPYLVSGGILGLQKASKQKVSQLTEKGNYNKAQIVDFITTTTLQNGLVSFIGGRANFLYLALTATPLGFSSAYSEWAKSKNKIKDTRGLDTMSSMDSDDLATVTKHMNLAKEYMTRAILGTTAMMLYGLSMWGDDEEEKGIYDEALNNLYKTKSGRRFINKFLPIGLSIMAIFDAESDDARQNKWNRFADIATTHLDMLSGIDGFMETIKNPKIPNDKKVDALISLISNSYSANISQNEQITRFKHILESIKKDDGIVKVITDEQIAREAYMGVEDIWDIIIGQGAIRQMQRWNDGQFNRFEQDSNKTNK